VALTACRLFHHGFGATPGRLSGAQQTNAEHLNANFGYQFSPDAETRFWVNADRWRAEISGEVAKTDALTRPKAANPDFVLLNEQRNIATLRLANKTTLRFDETIVDLGVFGFDRHVDYPIFQYLDFTAQDYDAFVRATDDRSIVGSLAAPTSPLMRPLPDIN